MIRGRKGIVEALLVAYIALAVIGTMLFGPTVSKMMGLSHDQKVTTVTKSEPILVKTADGQEHWMTKTDTTISDKEVPMSIWQKIWNLGLLWIILMVLGLFFPPVALVMKKFNDKAVQVAKIAEQDAKVAYDGLKTETVKIVSGVSKARAAMDEASKAKMSSILNDHFNDSTKALVDDIKTNGTITK